ncbi:MAG: metallophosphoesterase [Bacteroidales bacterium]|jgi:predicted phosphodiesterase|nr:metallophosphoesterase [Bacteroidales bacterium]
MRRNSICCLVFSVALIAAFFTGQAQVPDNENFYVTHGPYLQNAGTTGVTVVWTTNRPAIPGVKVTAPDGSSFFVRNSTDGIVNGGSLVHKVRIDGLDPGSKYKYSISSVQVLKYQAYRVYYGDTLNRKAEDFTTYPFKKDNISFLVVNDIHDNAAKLSSCLRNGFPLEKDLVFFNGDMVDFLQDPEQLFKGFIDSAVYYFASAKPFYYVRGNHETRGYLARELKGYFDYPGDRFYYSFDYGTVHFTVLDCGEDKPDNNRYYYGLADYDSYRSEQLRWLKEEVESENWRKARFRIVFIHMPVIREEKQGYGMKYLSENFGPLLDKAGADLMISAHTHRNAFLEKGKSGFSYPVIVNSNNTFLEVFAGEDDIMAALRDVNGKQISEYVVKARK